MPADGVSKDRNSIAEDTSQPSASWLFAQAILGNPIPDSSRAASDARAARAHRQWLDAVAPDRDRSNDPPTDVAAATDASAAWQFAQAIQGKPVVDQQQHRQWLADISTMHEGEWDPSKHPRGGFPQNRGWWSSTGGAASGGSDDVLAANAPTGSGGGGKGRAAKPGRAADPSNWYLPSDEKGTWVGEKGNSAFRFKAPVEVNGKTVEEIVFTNGLPELENFSLPGETATIVLTGDNATDIRNAKKAWLELNPGKVLPPDSTFHHDLRQVVEEMVEIDGKQIKVLVGKMQLVPTKVNKAIFHEGSASVADKFYKGLNINVASVKELAKAQSLLAGNVDSFVAKAAAKIVPGQIARKVLRFAGRNVVRAIPIIGTGLAILEFSDNVEAHGIGGAVARAIPVLGDLISAHDFGSDLARQIGDEANAAMGAAYKAANTPVEESWQKASEQTIEAFQELASQIEVTNPYAPNGLVDPSEVAEALKLYRDAMQSANYLKASRAKGFDFDTAAAKAKQELRQRLTKAAQKNSSGQRGPLL